MKGLNLQCQYDVDDTIYRYTAFNSDGSLCLFVNTPVRNFGLEIWVDSVTGEPGVMHRFDKWDQSMRIIGDLANCRTPHMRKGMKAITVSPDGKKNVKYSRKGNT